MIFAPLVSTLLILVLAPAAAQESVPQLLQRQTQEMMDAVSNGTAAVWERYLDPDVRYVDESGAVQTKKKMVEDIQPLPAGVSGSIRVIEYDAAVHDTVAVGTYISDENEDYHGHKLHCQYRTVDTWKKTPEGWRLVAGQVLALRTDPPSVTLTADLRRQYVGKYALSPEIAYEIKVNGDVLEGQQTGHKSEALQAEAPDVLFVPGKPRYRYVLLRDAEGRITGLAQRREAWDLVWKRTP